MIYLMQFWSLLKIQLRRKHLNKQFSSYYKDLLNAISNDNYDALESLCEQTLTIELAAKIYEFQRHRGVQFRVVDPQAPIQIDIINHFYVSNMNIERKENPSLREFKMITRQKNWIDFVQKGSDEGEGNETQTLALLEQLKVLYHMETDENPKTMTKHRREQLQLMHQPQLSEDEMIQRAQERTKFEKSQYVQKETLKAFKEIMNTEYRLRQLYKPQSLYLEVDKYNQEVAKIDQMKMEIDHQRLASKKQEYLEQLKNEVHSQSGTSNGPVMMDIGTFIEKEKEKSDLYLFTQLFCPALYNKYVRIERPQGEADVNLNSKNSLIVGEVLKNVQSSQISKGRIAKFSQWLRGLLFRSKKQTKSKKLIEVFDVLVSSRQRLQLFHLDSGKEYICNSNLSDYHQRMKLKFDAQHPTSQEEDQSQQVYILEVDKSKYDPSFSNYEQMHLLRFEIDRSKGTDKKIYSMKITDVDYWLQGNRHALAHSKEFMESKM